MRSHARTLTHTRIAFRFRPVRPWLVHKAEDFRPRWRALWLRAQVRSLSRPGPWETAWYQHVGFAVRALAL